MSTFLLLFIIAMAAAVIFGIVYIETAQRRIPIQYARRMQGRRVYGGQSSHLPLKINTSGVIPPIFASSLLVFPATIGDVCPRDERLCGLSHARRPGITTSFMSA